MPLAARVGSADAEPQEARERVKKVLFVCTANVCRSPMAAAMFNALAEDRGLPWRAESAGVAALEGEPTAENALEALREVGIYPEAHRARQVSAAMFEEADLVLAMSPRHVAALRKNLGDLSANKLYTLVEYASGAPSEEGIPDPYGHTITAYRASVRQLLEHVERLLGRLEERASLPQ
jgi:protein-tyrosine phosphatase